MASAEWYGVCRKTILLLGPGIERQFTFEEELGYANGSKSLCIATAVQ